MFKGPNNNMPPPSARPLPLRKDSGPPSTTPVQTPRAAQAYQEAISKSKTNDIHIDKKEQLPSKKVDKLEDEGEICMNRVKPGETLAKQDTEKKRPQPENDSEVVRKGTSKQNLLTIMSKKHFFSKFDHQKSLLSFMQCFHYFLFDIL